MKEPLKASSADTSEHDATAALIPGHCPRFEHASDILGKRWTGLILRLLKSGPRRFSELESHIPGLSPRMLSQRLKELEDEEIVSRQVHADRSIMVIYELTSKGEALMPVIDAISEWAETWL